MSRAAVALFLALSMGACAAAENPEEPSAETTEALATLEDRITDLEAEIRADLEAQDDDGAKMSDRLDRSTARLERSLERLREALAGVKDGSSEASEAAAAALSAARSVASELSVLEERYDYHLRRYHGGGG